MSIENFPSVRQLENIVKMESSFIIQDFTILPLFLKLFRLWVRCLVQVFLFFRLNFNCWWVLCYINKITSWYSPSLLEALWNKAIWNQLKKITLDTLRWDFMFSKSHFTMPIKDWGGGEPTLHRNHICTYSKENFGVVYWVWQLPHRKIVYQCTTKFLRLSAQWFFFWVWIET